MTVLDYPEVMQALRAVVAEAGEDYTYVQDNRYMKRCLYVRDGAPSCIVGRTLARLGVPVGVLSRMDARTDSMFGGLRDVMGAEGWGFTDQAFRALVAAQGEQDLGWTWGTALRAAEGAAP